MKYIIAFALGVMVATVGFSGVAHVLDRSVDSIKTWSKSSAN